MPGVDLRLLDDHSNRTQPYGPRMGTTQKPTLTEQRAFWDGWNQNLRTTGIDPFMEAQLRTARPYAARAERILDVGCGTGWLGGSLAGEGRVVTGVDLSPAAIDVARETWPDVSFLAGDFDAIDPEATFDLVVSADVIAHVADQPGFIKKVAALTEPGGVFLLMTQNRAVWNHTRSVSAQGAGQLRDWPNLGNLWRWMNDAHFTVERVTSIVPGGNKGVYRLVNNHYLADFAARLGKADAWVAARERARFGRELVIVGRRR